MLGLNLNSLGRFTESLLVLFFRPFDRIRYSSFDSIFIFRSRAGSATLLDIFDMVDEVREFLNVTI